MALSLHLNDRYQCIYSEQMENSSTSGIDNNLAASQSEEILIPVVQEHLKVSTKLVETGRVNISKKVSQEDFTIDVPVTREEVSVEKKAINRYVDELPPATRQEGDTTIISVFREVLVVEKKILLVEEVHITKKTIEATLTANDTLRKEEVIVTRTSNNFNE